LGVTPVGVGYELVFDSTSVSDAVRAKELLAGVHTALDELRQIDLDRVDGDDLAGLVEDLYRLDARLTGARCTVLRRFDAAKAWQPSGARTATAWVATRTRVPKAMAGSELRMARRLAHHPATDAALADGDIPADAARMLMGCAAGRTGEHFDDQAEQLLLGEAKRQRHRDLERICRYWEQVVDPDGTDDDAQARHARRGLSLSQLPDGTWRLDSNLDVIGGTEVATELRRIEAEFFQDDLRRLRAEHGEGASLDLIARTPKQRRADALAEMARRSAATPPGATKPRPLITVLVGYERFHGPILETLNRTVITPTDLARHLDGADIERIVFDSPNRVIDVGVTRRLFVGATRRAVEVRDKECTHPYCDLPAHLCEVDHIDPHCLGGPTTQANGRLRCRYHNPEVPGRPGGTARGDPTDDP
jgi:hypothetical protein